MKRTARLPSPQISFKDLILIVSVCLAFVFLLVVAVQSYISTVGYITNQLTAISTGIVEQNAKTIENNILQIQRVTEYLARDVILLGYLRDYDTLSGAEKVQINTDIKSRMNIMGQFNEYILGITVVTGDSALTSKQEGLFNIDEQLIAGSEYGRRTAQGEGSAVFFSPLESLRIQREAGFGIEALCSNYCFASVIGEGGSQYGYLFVTIDPDAFEMLTGSSFLVDGTGSVVASSSRVQQPVMEAVLSRGFSGDAGDTGYDRADGNRYYYRYIAAIGMNLVYVQSNAEFGRSMNQYRWYLAAALLIIVLLAFFLSRIISTRITQPLKRLTTSVKDYVFSKTPRNPREEEGGERDRLTMRESILGYLIGVVIVPVSLFLVVSYIISERTIETYVVDSYSVAFEQAAQNIEYYMDSKVKIMKNIIFNITIQESLRSDLEERDAYDYDDVVDRGFMLGRGRDEVFLFTENGKMVFSNTDMRLNAVIDSGLLAQISDKRVITNWIATRTDAYGRNIFSLVLKINSLEDFNNIGFLACQIPEYELENIYKTILKDDTSIFLVDDGGKIISHPDKSLVTAALENFNPSDPDGNLDPGGQNQFVFIRQIQGVPWYLVGQYSLDVLSEDNQSLASDKFYLFTVILLLTIIVAFLFAFTLTRTLGRMNRVLERMKITDLDVMFGSRGAIIEVNELKNAFHEMIYRNELLISQLLDSAREQADLENRKKKSELTALQYQINPHFMYNSFDGVNWLIRRDRKKEALAMIDSLSLFFRHVARADDPVVLISEEIAHARSYVEIMRMRYGDQIDFQWDIDEELLDAKTIRLSLQPVIENAIYHGIHASQQEGMIEIACRTADDGRTILFTVADSGAGMSQDQLDQIMSDIGRSDPPGSIGLHNIESRIKLYFGEEYGIRIQSRVGMGTIVEIRIPNTREEVNEEKEQSK